MSDIRRENLLQRIEEAQKLLASLEAQHLTSSDPKERMRLEREIEETKTELAEYKKELGALGSSLSLKNSCPKPPAPPEKFAGRDKELADLCQRLRTGQITAITAVDGLGGIGKTTLAKQAANDLWADKTFRAVLWADITRNPDWVQILDGWLKLIDNSLSLPVVSQRQQAAFVKNALEEGLKTVCEECQPNRTLVVLDDVWDSGVSLVRVLKEACPAEATILLTTRSHNAAVDLAGKDSRQLNRLEGEAARELLRLYLEKAAPQQLDELAKLLGGHPLALTLAAKRVLKKMGDETKVLEKQLEEYRRKIPAATSFKDLKLGQGEQRDDNLELVLSYSYDELTENDQARFRALGVLAHDQPFDSGILAALWQIDDSDELEEICDRFCLLSLMQRAAQPTSSATEWFALHPLLQAYARALLHQHPDEYTTILTHYQDYIIEIGDQFAELSREKWDTLTPYLPQVHQVGNGLVREFEQNGEKSEEWLRRAQAFALSTDYYLYYRREVREGNCQEKWPEMGLVVSRQLQDKENISYFLTVIGDRLKAYGQKKAALNYYNQSLVIRRELGHPYNEAANLNNIGDVYRALGDREKALEYYQQALPLIQQVGTVGGEATILNNIGLVYDDLGDNTKALEYFQQALPLCQQVGDKGGEAANLNNIGSVYWVLGDKAKALEYYQQALPLYQQVGDKGGEATTLNNIGIVYWALSDNIKALKYCQQALPLCQQVGDVGGQATTLNNISSVYWALGDKEKAFEYLQQALPLRHQVGDKSGEAKTSYNIGVVFYEQGELENAIKYLAHCVDLKEQVQDPDLEQSRQLLAEWRAELQEK